MLSRTLPLVSAFAGTIAMSLWVGVPSAAGGPPDVDGGPIFADPEHQLRVRLEVDERLLRATVQPPAS